MNSSNINHAKVGLRDFKPKLIWFSGGKWTKKLEFESGNDRRGPKLEPQADKPNCFTIGGQVEVLEVKYCAFCFVNIPCLEGGLTVWMILNVQTQNELK